MSRKGGVMATVQEIAAEALGWFTDYQRGDDTITVLKDGTPDWVRDMVYAAHGDMGPDDWRYECIRAAVQVISEYGDDADPAEFADGMVDTYTHDRLRWLASHLDRPAYCDEAAEDMGSDPTAGIIDRIGWGQYLEAEQVFGMVAGFLSTRAGS